MWAEVSRIIILKQIQACKYGFTNFGIVPSFVMKEDDWTLNIGAGLFYG
jgi:hypothetical protein